MPPCFKISWDRDGVFGFCWPPCPRIFSCILNIWYQIDLKFSYSGSVLTSALLNHLQSKTKCLSLKKDQKKGDLLPCWFTFCHCLMLVINLLISSRAKMNEIIKNFIAYRQTFWTIPLCAVSGVNEKQSLQCS